ncbi:MCE family protein [Nocardia jiangxiensis]|uniref:MCE family protein n=1 Tax=Nocardia jiangxiensis TaxID=282685 RepID=A0ABW6S962_9NOCA|nr:MCE family protein [Nocardia jiangxiensis]
MKRLSHFRAGRVGIVGLVMTVAICLVALQFDRIPMLNTPTLTYSAMFSDASGLLTGDDVSAAGVQVGTVTDIAVDTGLAKVTFSVNNAIALGNSTTAAIKTTSLLGKRSIEITPSGSGRMRPHGVIPIERTRSGYTLPNILNEATDAIRDIDLGQLTQALDSASDVLIAAAPQVGPALDGMKRLAQTVNERDRALRQLLSGAQQVTSVLADRAPQVNKLLLDGNSLLGELQVRSQALGGLITGITRLSQQLSGTVHEDNAALTPALSKLGQVLTLLNNNRDNISQSIQGLSTYIGTLGDAVASGPYFYAYIQNLVPGDYTQPLLNTVFGLPPAPLPIPQVK